jgi:hypothetical protein
MEVSTLVPGGDRGQQSSKMNFFILDSQELSYFPYLPLGNQNSHFSLSCMENPQEPQKEV